MRNHGASPESGRRPFMKAAKACAFHEARSPPQVRLRPGMSSSSSSSTFSSSFGFYFLFLFGCRRVCMD